jgi:hypothetical protein
VIAARKALNDAAIQGDRSAILARLCERHDHVFAATLRQLERGAKP